MASKFTNTRNRIEDQQLRLGKKYELMCYWHVVEKFRTLGQLLTKCNLTMYYEVWEND